VLADIPFAKTHDLGRLGTLAAPAYPKQAELFAATYLFTAWGFEFRYPGPEVPDEPTDAELRDALAVIERIADCLRASIRAEPAP
jgi:hypothetical protein